MYRNHRCRHNHDDSGMGCLLAIVLGLMAMPLVGLYLLLAGKNSEQKVIGMLLTIVGVILWIMASVS